MLTVFCSGILAIKRDDEILSFVTTWMDLEGVVLSDVCQTEKDKYHRISLICGIQSKQKRLIEIRITLVVPRRDGVGGWVKTVKGNTVSNSVSSLPSEGRFLPLVCGPHGKG